MRSKKILIPRKSRHCQTLIMEWKLIAKAELNSKPCLKKSDSFVIRAALWAERLGRCLEYCRSWKSTLGKFAFAINTGDHSIRVLNERSVSDGGNFCPLWLEILKSLGYNVGDTSELRYNWLWAALPWNGLENTSQKAGLCVYFNWFKNAMFWCFIPALTPICVNNYFVTEDFWNKLMS